MNITYRREMKHNYLIVEPDDSGPEPYEMHMLKENRINGLLNFNRKLVDGHNYYYYEITSKQPLNRILENHSLNKEELKQLIIGIAHLLERLDAYLLKADQILLQPEYIYLEPEQFRVSLCLLPGRNKNFPGEMTELLRYLLGKINHQDKECVVMAYGLYQESLKENYGIHRLEELVRDPMEKPDLKEEKNDRGGKGFTGEPEYEPILTSEEKKEIHPIPELSLHKKTQSAGFHKGKVAILILAVITCTFAVIWSIAGYSGIRKFWYAIPAAGIITAFCATVKLGKSSLENQKEELKTESPVYEQEHEEWQMAFYEETKEPQIQSEPDASEEVMQTVLLTSNQKDTQARVLKAVGLDSQDIPVAYTPFLIGKQEGLVDFVLDGESISRIHAKIDREGNEYQITDLNSTNGTFVNGRLLETNETVMLHVGDELFIANFAFIFT